jgi:hypothetical protein
MRAIVCCWVSCCSGVIEGSLSDGLCKQALQGDFFENPDSHVKYDVNKLTEHTKVYSIRTGL